MQWKNTTINRIFEIGKRNENSGYLGNEIKNSKYTVLTFIPSIFITYVKRFMNLYFFIIATLQSIKDLSPVDPMSTWIPIFCIFLITYIREGIDDYKNHMRDNKTNNREYVGYMHNSRKIVLSKDFQVGDIIILKRNEEAPADFILLCTSEKNGTCSIETSNLDGETYLKERAAVKYTQEIGASNISGFHGIVTCQAPNISINEFKGTINYHNKVYSIDETNFIQCGTKIKNNDFVIGVVAYCGKETKLGLNSKTPPIKWTKLEKFLNKISICVFITQWTMAFIAGTIANLYQKANKDSMKYLAIESYELIDWIIMYVRFFLLTTTMIPISLKVILDMCKMIYGKWIESDKKMTSVVVGERINTKCINTSVIEDLGSIEYIFADKTGTLTDNVMELKKLSVKGTMYGNEDESSSIYDDNKLRVALDNKNIDAYKLIRALLLCNTLKIEQDGEFGSSPEEIAFVGGIKKLGFEITQNENVFTISSNLYKIVPTSYKVEKILPFSYERRRMSVIVSNTATDQYLLISKGASEVIGDLCRDQYSSYNQQIDFLSSLGLRVMGISEKEITKEEFYSFKKDLDIIGRNIELRNREESLLFTRFESQSTLLGLAAIEDRLQIGVPDAIDTLRKAGIKIWMITGDIMQTALKISRSTKLIQDDGRIFTLTKEHDASATGTITNIFNWIRRKLQTNPNFVFYFAIDGSPTSGLLSTLLSPSFIEDFKELACKAKCVIVSRVTPAQKAQIVESIKELGKMTLAIGDGGNDVTMIRAADVGVGIVGKEGSQAAAAADFSTYQFRNLVRLLLIHGRYSCYRTSWLSQFCFYKSTVVCIIQVLYMFSNCFSGASFFNSFNLMSYNAFFTVLPVFYYLQDKDIREELVMKNPRVYLDSQRSIFLNKKTLFKWYSKGIYQAIVLSLLWNIAYSEESVSSIDGNAFSLEEAQQVIYTALIFVVLITVTLDTQTFTFHNYIFVWGSLVLYLIGCFIASSIPGMKMLKEMFLVGWRIFNDVPELVILIVAISISIVPPYFIRGVISSICPTKTQRIKYTEQLELKML